MSKFIVGSVVKYVDCQFEMRSWRNENGALVNGPPDCEVTVESVEGYDISVAWFEGAKLQRETFPSKYFEFIR
jgi:hypothetical protein